MSGIAFLYNLCDVDVFVSINSGSVQRIAAVQEHEANATQPHHLHFAAVPQTRNRMPYHAWEFGVDTEPVINTLEYRLGDKDGQPISLELAMCLLKHPTATGPLQVPLEMDSRLYLHPEGALVCAGGRCTQVTPGKLDRGEEQAC